MANESNGSMWITGTYLHWRNGSNTQFRFLGTSIATPVGAVVGSLWTEANNVHYIDSVGAERQVAGSFIATQAPAGALAGSMWLDTGYAPSTSKGQLHFVGPAQHEHWAHIDIPFSNAHTDIPFSNAHTDIPFSNSHTDNPFSNSHTDIAGYYDDYHGDGPDAGGFDRQFYADAYNPYQNSHSDSPFSNAHTDIGASISHTDIAASISHTDIAASTSHTDISHTDQPTAV